MTDDDDLTRLDDLLAQRDALEMALYEEVGRLRDDGVPWDRIGMAMGTTKQGAWNWWSRRRDALERPK